jgi:hypothetical protein
MAATYGATGALITPAVSVIVLPSPFTAPNAAEVASGNILGVNNPPAVVSTIVLFPVIPKGTLDVIVVALPATANCPVVMPDTTLLGHAVVPR